MRTDYKAMKNIFVKEIFVAHGPGAYELNPYNIFSKWKI